MLTERMKNKGLGGLLCLVAAVVALVTAVVFLATQETAAPLGHTGAAPGVALVAGVAVAVALFLAPLPFGALVQAGVYAYAMYLMVTQLYFVFADVINQVTYAGGNAGLCIGYMAGALVSCLLCVVACFLPQTADDAALLKAGARSMAPGAVASALIVVAAVVAVNLGVGSASAGSAAGGSAAASAGSEASGGATMTLEANEFADLTIDELVETPRADWEAKEAAGQVAYFFEGQYTEGFSTIVDPGCLDLYLCADGSMYGTFSGPVTSVASGAVQYVYGYWYNADESGTGDFVLHLTGTQYPGGEPRATNVEGGEDADIYVFETDHGDYSWEASFSYGVWGGAITRNINIYGQRYAAAQSLSIDASELGTFYMGDSLDPSALTVSCVRGSGTVEDIWPGRLSYSGYDPQKTGTQTVTASFLGATATFEVEVEDLVAETYTGTYGLVTDGAVAETEATVVVDYSHKTVTIAAADGSASVAGTLAEVGDGTLAMMINGSDELVATLADGVLTIPAHQEVVSDYSSSTTYDIGEHAFTLSTAE